MAMQGVCTQRHFPAVAQPFKVLWAPWSLAVTFFGLAFILSMFSFAVFGGAVGGLLFPVLILLGHGAAVGFGLKLQYFASIVGSIDAHKTGSTNLSRRKSSYEFANL